jgi:hypothetical protein
LIAFGIGYVMEIITVEVIVEAPKIMMDNVKKKIATLTIITGV